MKEKILLILQEHSFNSQDGIVIDNGDFNSIAEIVADLFVSQDKWISVEEQKIIWSQIINDCKWNDGSPLSFEKIIQYFMKTYSIKPLPKASNTK